MAQDLQELRLQRARVFVYNGAGLELSVVAVVLLAGVSIFGGKGKMWAVVVAIFLLGTIRNALTLNDRNGCAMNGTIASSALPISTSPFSARGSGRQVHLRLNQLGLRLRELRGGNGE